jgi:hypothetical protein
MNIVRASFENVEMKMLDWRTIFLFCFNGPSKSFNYLFVVLLNFLGLDKKTGFLRYYYR